MKEIFDKIIYKIKNSKSNMEINMEYLLGPDDFVGKTFFIISIAMLMAGLFFYMERDRVTSKWKLTLSVAAIIHFTAAAHYWYMREVWLMTEESPTVYRYIDWIITVPLQMVEFYLIAAAVGKTPVQDFFNLLLGSFVMIAAGYLGEVGYISAMQGFVVGMIGWLYIIYVIFAGPTAKVIAKHATKSVLSAFSAMRLIVTIGWAIYPLGYFMGYMMDGVDATSLNVIYNIGDFVNKIAFGLFIWSAAVSDSESKK